MTRMNLNYRLERERERLIKNAAKGIREELSRPCEALSRLEKRQH